MVFSKKMAPKLLQIYITFLIHIDADDALMLYRKFELIPTSIFQVTIILINQPIFEKYPRLYIAHGFFQKIAPKSPQIFITFPDTY